MWFLRLAKSLHKLFQTQFLFGTKIKSTYKNLLCNAKILDLSVKRGCQRPIHGLGPRQKWIDLPLTFFELFIAGLFYWFSDILLLTLEYSKKKICPIFPFWQDVAHFDFGHGQKLKTLTFTVKHLSFVLSNDHVLFYEKIQNF